MSGFARSRILLKIVRCPPLEASLDKPTCIAALLDRLTHHANVTLIEGTSYRVRESELEAAAHKKNSERNPRAQRS